ncbi:uncharacterized protein ACN63O_019618 [Diretmus argenteus]
MENSSVASASSEAGSSRSQEIEELERFIDSYVLEYQVQGLLGDKADGDLDLDNGGKMPQWTEDCNDKKDGSRSSRGRGSSKPDEWEHSSNGSTGSRPSSGSRPGSGSRSGSRGRNNQFKGPAKNGNRDGSLDILGTDIWAANTMDSHGGAGWDVQPEKLDFSQFHRKHYRGTPKHLPQIDREGVNKIKFEEDDGIDMNDIERFLPHLHSLPVKNELGRTHMTSIVVAFPLNKKPTNVSIMFKPKQKTGAQKRKIRREQEKAKAKMTKLDKFFKVTQPTLTISPGSGSLTESAPAAGIATGAPSSEPDSSDIDTPETSGSSANEEDDETPVVLSATVPPRSPSPGVQEEQTSITVEVDSAGPTTSDRGLYDSLLPPDKKLHNSNWFM